MPARTDKTAERIRHRLSLKGERLMWSTWTDPKSGVECNESLCAMHREELRDYVGTVTVSDNTEDFGCMDCEGDLAYGEHAVDAAAPIRPPMHR